jgi:hypothetical protein
MTGWKDRKTRVGGGERLLISRQLSIWLRAWLTQRACQNGFHEDLGTSP